MAYIALDFASSSLVPRSRSLDFRDKLLKVVVYACKLGALYNGSKKLAHIAKQISSARKIFALLHWVKYSDDARSALVEPPGAFRAMSLLDTALTLLSDMGSDLSTLGSLGVVPLSKRHMELIDWWSTVIDAAYCLVAMVTGAVGLARKQRALAAAPPDKQAGAQRKVTLGRLGVLKYCLDFVKDCHGAGLHGLRGEGVPATVAITAGLLSGAISTHKWNDKLAPSAKAKAG